MDEDFTTAMQGGAREVADQTNLPPVRLIRAQGDQRRRRRAAGSVGLLLVAAGAIGVGIVRFSGPGQDGPGPTATTSTSTSTPTPTPTPTPGTSETPSSERTSAAEATSLPNCAMAQLKITLGQANAGAGHSGQVLLFRNIGSAACRLHGYPDVKALDADGNVMEQARQTLHGYMGGVVNNSTPLPSVDLDPGQSASALEETLNANASDGSACTPYKSLLVTAPNETHSISLPVTVGGCSNLQVHPVVPGDIGDLR